MLSLAWRQEKSVLHEAAVTGQLEITKLLISRGASIAQYNPECEDGNSALIETAKNGHLEIVKLLLDNNIDVLSQ